MITALLRWAWLGGVAVALCACGDSHTSDLDAGGLTDTGGGDDFRVCAVNSDCLVVPASCCGACGAATRADSIAVSRARASDYRTSVCGDDVGCPACFMPQDPTLVSTCAAGRCEVVDLHLHPSAACADATECRLRTQACCECGGDTGPEGLIAVRVDGEAGYAELVCDPGMGCPECLPMYPTDAVATCSDEGFCEVLRAGT